MPPPKRKRGRINIRRKIECYCSHCGVTIQLRTFKDHVNQYWDHDHWTETRRSLSAKPHDGVDPVALIEQHESASSASLIQQVPMMPLVNVPAQQPKPIQDGGQVEDLHDIDINRDNIEMMSDHIELDVLPSESDTEDEYKPMHRGNLQLVFYQSLRLWQVTFRVSQNAMRVLLLMLYTFLQLTGKDLVAKPPDSGDALHKIVPVDPNLVELKTACLKCKTLYSNEDTYKKERDASGKTIQVPRPCSYVELPNAHKPSQCGSLLSKQHTFSSTKSLEKVPYARIAIQLRKMLKRPGFKKDCLKWRTREEWLPFEVMADIYDGSIWKSWGAWLKDSDYNLGLQLNLDWLEPHKHSQYSLGAIYLVILNLPREIRYKRENVILVASLPDNSKHVDTTSRLVLPMVKELLHLWENGEELFPGGPKFSAALLQVTADLPAGRVVSGLLAHNANFGCSRCDKKFREKTKKRDTDKNSPTFDQMVEIKSTPFGGFKKDGLFNAGNTQWTDTSRRLQADKWLKATTAKERANLAKESGCRWTSLYLLPYYDSVKFLAIDSMHNLYMGVAKKILKVWDAEGVLDFKVLEKRCKDLNVPRGIGRVLSSFQNKNKKADQPKKFKSLTAEEMMSFVVLYSDQLLFGLVDAQNYKMWKHFSFACRGSSARLLYKEDIPRLQESYFQFLVLFEKLYPDDCVPNMHLGHESFLSLLDYGPNHTSWCFAFERMNGILGKVHLNNKAIQLTIHNSFVSAQQCNITTLSRRYPELSQLWNALRQTDDNEDTKEWHRIMATTSASDHIANMQMYWKAVKDVREGQVGLLFWYWKPACLIVSHQGNQQAQRRSLKMLQWTKHEWLKLVIWKGYEYYYNYDLATGIKKTTGVLRGKQSVCVSALPLRKSSRLRIFNTILGSAGSQYEPASYILSIPARDINGAPGKSQAGQVQCYYEMNASHNPVTETGERIEDDERSNCNKVLMAYVRWYVPWDRPKESSRMNYTGTNPGKGASLDLNHLLVFENKFEADSHSSWLPVMHIKAQFIPHHTNDHYYVRNRHGNASKRTATTKVIVACPVPLKYAL